MEKELKKAIKQIMKYDFYDSNKKPIEINLKANKTEELLRKAFLDSIMAIEYIMDDDEELKTIDDQYLQELLGDDIVDLFERVSSTPQQFTEDEIQELKEQAEKLIDEKKPTKKSKPKKEKEEVPEDEEVTEIDVLLEEAIEEAEESKKKKKKRSTGYDKYGFRSESKCAMIMALVEQNKFTFKDLVKAVEGKTNIDPRKIIRVVNAKGKFRIARNENSVYMVEAIK